MPMTEYKEFLSQLSRTHYSPDDISSYVEVFGRVGLAEKHGLRISVGGVSMSGDYFLAGDENIGFPATVAKIDLTSYPIGAAYEFSFSGFDDGTSAFVGLGASIYVSSLEVDVIELEPSVFPGLAAGERTGQGFGVEGFIGQRARVNKNISIGAQVRGRWADGFIFSDKEGDIKIMLSGFDLSVYGEWRFE
jgi:hypothetical protein